MQRRSLIRAVSVAIGVVAARLFRLYPFAASAAPTETPTGDMMGGMMGGHGMDEMMKPDNMMGPMRTGMELFMRHTKIRRSVTDLPNGIRAVTESDDPQTAAFIQAHVSEMYQRLDQNHAFPYPMSRSVPEMFEHSTRYQRKLVPTPKGVAVTETADDPAMVVVIRQHALEISDFVRDGMPAMMRGMMR
jgi:hypothetical protein